ncbi:MAG: ECF transporter S component [Desulfurococcaceae archaeon]|nr:ECF transporter S component [Desulfurococcaceae archaeon]
MTNKREFSVVEAVIFTVLVYAATIVIQVYQPATGGYFNIGESMIYLAALFSTPLIAGVAGGVGAALADLSTGYAIFAPGTLVIKFIEGYVAGLAVRVLRGRHGSIYAAITAVVYTTLFILISVVLWAGGIYVGPEKWLHMSFSPLYVEVSVAVWIAIGIVLGALVAFILLRRHVTTGEVAALAIAGSLMVLGYFLYEYFYSNPATGREPVAAILEVPVNIGQVVVGLSVSIPLTAWLRRAGYIKY